MRIAYHKYELKDETYVNGANLFYQDVSEILKNEKNCHAHDFRDWLDNPPSNFDAVISNIGPYAYFYFYLREKYSLKFNIIRDVQTSFLSSYFLQEYLCCPRMRDGDKVLFLSEYCRQVYLKLFPDYLNEENTYVCCPAASFFPKPEPKLPRDKDVVILGYVGRVSRDKNFHQILKTFIELSNTSEKTIKFLVIGRPDDEFLPEKVTSMLRTLQIPENNYLHLNDGKFLKHEYIWHFFSQMDVLLFPSVSSVEALGRVVLEANHLKIPVIAARYAASPELLSESNLLNVKFYNRTYSTSNLHSIGEVDEAELKKKIINFKDLNPGSNIEYKNHDKKLINILNSRQKPDSIKRLHPSIRNFIDGAEIDYNGFKTGDDIMRKAVELLMKYDYKNLASTGYLICRDLGFNPKLKINVQMQ
jgi:glycosyltransferase involved in cell wall biosynthesis